MLQRAAVIKMLLAGYLLNSTCTFYVCVGRQIIAFKIYGV